ncbi:MAG: hypothetical protein HOP30_02105 [Cyclobacteriaceae bacterium]|nr:hypothetical protein [Cyclobacteriaceae bacterium]
MKYKFNIHKYSTPNGIEKERPIVDIENPIQYGWFFYDEINNLSFNPDYVKEIVSKLEEVLSGKLKNYDGFGYEMYMIECDKENAKVKNIFEGGKVDAVIPTAEVYELMREWRDYIEKYNQKNPTNYP